MPLVLRAHNAGIIVTLIGLFIDSRMCGRSSRLVNRSVIWHVSRFSSVIAVCCPIYAWQDLRAVNSSCRAQLPGYIIPSAPGSCSIPLQLQEYSSRYKSAISRHLSPTWASPTFVKLARTAVCRPSCTVDFFSYSDYMAANLNI